MDSTYHIQSQLEAKKAIKVLNQTFIELKLEKHPERTVIVRIEKGFDFLGYHISPEGLSLAKKTVENFIEGGVPSHTGLGCTLRGGVGGCMRV